MDYGKKNKDLICKIYEWTINHFFVAAFIILGLLYIVSRTNVTILSFMVIILVLVIAIMIDHLRLEMKATDRTENETCECREKVKRYFNFPWQWIIDNSFGFIFAVFSIFVIINIKWVDGQLIKTILIAFTMILAVVVHHLFKYRLKEQKKGHFVIAFFLFLWLAFLIIPWPKLLLNTESNAFISISVDNETKFLQINNTKIISWPNRTIISNSEADNNKKDPIQINGISTQKNGNIDEQIYLFSQYSWYISLIITILGVLAGALMYYNWRSNQKIKEEWEKLSKKTFKKEAEINEAFYGIRNEVLNDPRLGNGKDEEKLHKFATSFRDWNIDIALKYAFAAREIQPGIKENGKYNDEDVIDWEAALQYWQLAACYLPDKDAYDKEHKGFIYNGLGNALRELANYARNILDNNGLDDCSINNELWEVVKKVLFYFGNALSSYEMALASDYYNNLVLNNKANLFMDVNRLKEKLSKCKNWDEQRFFEYWQQAVASSPIMWEKIITFKAAYFSSAGLINESHDLLKKLLKIDGLSKLDYALQQDVWYYRNYAIACYLKVINMDPANDQTQIKELYDDFEKYIKKYVYCYKDGRTQAISKLEDDEDLNYHKAFQDEQIKKLFDEFKVGK
ncbi:MAG TPA: hypothetical protein DEF34_06700 [Desulfotomaculum sp.]|nr:MAG: hypothetical protein JL56_07875 [Desulfotomaculum sp. BICA1-6]HBX23299.1 hypothetical protein [Desulfotomaculum sp.]